MKVAVNGRVTRPDVSLGEASDTGWVVGGSGLSPAVVNLTSVALTGVLYPLPGAIKRWEPLPVVPHHLPLSIDHDDDGDSLQPHLILP